ncbi:MAG: hypothetical protein ACFCUT_05855 [Kiloniellaceae bacterium]
MTEINDLRERVEAAEQRFGLMDEQQRHYSERLIGLIETIETQLVTARGEIEKQIAENSRLTQENEELRSMLHSVLRSIEEKTFTRTLQNLEARVSALVTTTGGAVAEAAKPETGEPEIDAMVDAADSADEAALIVEAEAEDVIADTEATLPESDPTEEMIPESAAPEETPAEELRADDAESDEAPAEAAEMDAGAETPQAPLGEPDTAEAEGETDEADEVDDLFAAMTELNASDESFAAAVAEGTVPSEPEAEPDAMDEAEMAGAEMTEAEIAAEVAAEAAVEPEITEADPTPAEDIVEEMVEEAVVEAVDNMAPTVKEIIRRVGDLARELERAEAARRASRSDEEKAAAGPAAETETETETDDPPLDQAVNA